MKSSVHPWSDVSSRSLNGLVLWFGLLAVSGLALGQSGNGIFEGETDIGKPSKAGTAKFDSSTKSYVVSGGGENMWFTNDAFHFVWKKISGDFALAANLEWLKSGGNAHRKMCLLVRQDLTAESAYVDVAVHGDAMTSLQFRETAGGPTHEVQVLPRRPSRVGIERQGETFYMTMPLDGIGNIVSSGTSKGSEMPLAMGPCGAFMRIKLSDPFYVGIGVCAHDDKVLEEGKFNDVELRKKGAPADQKQQLVCALETIAVGSKDRRAVYYTKDHIEAPNWSRDGSNLIFNASGKLYRLPLTGGKPELIPTDFANRCNNDHGLSPDGKQLAISDQSQGGKSMIYLLPLSGGTPRQITKTGPSYWHGWSPDGSTLAYCAERGGEFDVYTISVDGGEEKRLTTAKGLDDGPDFSADGKWIYFNSDRSGRMQIWRMRPDGSEQTQVTSDEYNNWFPHPSPDNKWIAFLSYDRDVTGHPANQVVRLRMLPVGGGTITELARLFGGQGTINVPSWSPDSRQLAFVSYEMLFRP